MSNFPISQHGRALYYPYIRIQDLDWLKGAVLYWDGIRRIVPSDFHFQENVSINKLVDAGILIDTDPQTYVREAGISFLNFLSQKLELSGDLSRQQIQRRIDSLPDDYLPVGAINLQKLTFEVIHELNRLRLGFEDNMWIRVPPKIGGLYMSILSSIASGAIGSPLITDKNSIDEYQREIDLALLRRNNLSRSSSEQIIGNPRGFETTLTNLGIPFPSRGAIHRISVDKVIRFHHEHTDERRRFRLALDGLCREASSISDPNALNDYYADHRIEIESSNRDYQRAQQTLGIKSLASLLKVSVPNVFMASGAIAAGFGQPITAIGLTGVGFSFSFTEWRTNYNREQANLDRSYPWHYVLTVNKGMR